MKGARYYFVIGCFLLALLGCIQAQKPACGFVQKTIDEHACRDVLAPHLERSETGAFYQIVYHKIT